MPTLGTPGSRVTGRQAEHPSLGREGHFANAIDRVSPVIPEAMDEIPHEQN